MARKRKNRRRPSHGPGPATPPTPEPERQAAASPNRRSRRPRIWLRGAVGAGVVGLALVGTFQARHLIETARLPELPDLAARDASVADHLRAADQAARAEPASAAAVGALCITYHADLFYDEADRCYTRVAELEPMEWRWVYLRALARGDRGDGDALVSGMRRTVELAPEVGPAWWRIAEGELKDGRTDEAADAFRRARTAPEPAPSSDGEARERAAPIPLSAYADFGLARVALRRGDAEEAQRILLNLTAQAPLFGPAFRLLGDAYADLGLADAAARAEGQANQLPPYVPYADPMVDMLADESRNSTFLLQQAAGASVAIDPAWTEFLLRRAAAFDPDNPDVVLALGQLLRRAGSHAQALDLFRRHYELVPDDPLALGQVGVSLLDLGRFAEAESAFRQVLEDVDDAGTHYNLGSVLSTTGRLDEARVELERALELEPTRSDARGRLGVLLIRQGAMERATAELERVLELEPDNDSARTNLGLALVEQGRIDAAILQFREALRINPAQPQAQTALRALGVSP